MTTNEQLQHGRAKNAILAFFERRLSVPKIYIDANWDSHPIDVLAIDRDGVGDVHAVLIFLRKYSTDGDLDDPEDDEMTLKLVDRLAAISANFKYVAAVDFERDLPVERYQPGMSVMSESFHSPDGIGRVGLLHINLSADGPAIEVRLRPERFRAKIAKLADDYIQQHEPDWQVRA